MTAAVILTPPKPLERPLNMDGSGRTLGEAREVREHGHSDYERARQTETDIDDVDGLSPAACSAVGRGCEPTRSPSMQNFIRIGVDLAKNYFQVHALTDEGAPAVRL